MSYDVSLYFRDELFPFEQWQSVIAEFNPHEREVIMPGNTIAQWTVSRDGEVSWLMLRDVRPAECFKPTAAHWEVVVSRVGHSPQSIWLQFAVCYHALVLMPNVLFYDRQFSLTLADEAGLFSFASDRLLSVGTSKLFKMGLADAQGTLIF